MNPGYTSQPGSAARQLDYLEDWLIALVQQQKRTNELLERQGKPGSGTDAREESRIEKLGKRIESALASQLSYRLNQAQNLANRGFSGTVEQARMDYAMEMLGKQFAAVMKPVMDALTYGAVQIEARMRRMNGGDQNSLLGLGIGAVAGRMIGGLPGMLAGGAVGSAMMGGGSEIGTGIGIAGGAALGFRAAGPFGAVAGALAGGVMSSKSSYADEGPGAYYSRLREKEKYTMLGAAASTGLESVSRLFSTPKETLPTGSGSGAAPRRDVTPFQADMMDAGGSYFAIQKSMIRATAGADFEDAGPLKPIIDGMLDIIQLLAKIAGVDLGPPPASIVQGVAGMVGKAAGIAKGLAPRGAGGATGFDF